MRLGFTAQTPRPRHEKADAALQEAFKKDPVAQVSEPRSGGATGQAQRAVERWAMDEHRVGLKPILRRVWARHGKRPGVVVRPR